MRLLLRTIVRGAYKVAGLDSPYSSQDYGANWSKQRRKCLDRDGHTCRVCGTTEAEVGRQLSVHHIRPRSEFDGTPREMNSLDNLVTLCPTCHGQLEGRFIDTCPETFVEKARER